MLLFVAFHTTFDVVMACPKLVLYIVGGMELFLQTFVSWSKVVHL